jgi:CBS-domain-containing membrane protein
MMVENVAGRKAPMQVKKHMSAPAITVRADSDYRMAFDVMRERGVHHLPVVDADGHLVGIVAQRDMLIAATRHQNAPVEMAEVMRRPVISTKADLQIVEAARLMMNQKIGCLPVVDAEATVLGVITESDLFEVFVRMLSSGVGKAAPAKRPTAKKTPARKAPARKVPKRAKAKESARRR